MTENAITIEMVTGLLALLYVGFLGVVVAVFFFVFFFTVYKTGVSSVW